jgi:hypothetical protein
LGTDRELIMATLKSIKNKYLAASDGSTLGVDQNKDNISLLAFKMAAADSIAKFNMRDGMFDTFTDSTGIDSSSTNKTVLNGYVYGATTNYMGDGSDGTLSTSANVTHTVTTTNGPYDGDMVVKQYSSLTINAGHTMTVNQPCRGMFIYVAGDCTINGTLSMTGKGAAADPTVSGGSDANAVGTNGLQLGLMTAGGTQTFTNDGTGFNGAGTAVRTAIANTANISSSGTIFSISQLGATGPTGSSVTEYGGHADGVNGTTGASTISTGSGGTGSRLNPNGAIATPGDGGDGGAFSGGAGSGGAGANSGATAIGGAGGNYGGAGGDGANTSWGTVSIAGGAGNPGGSVTHDTYTPVPAYGSTPDGVGGIIWLIVGGNLTIGAHGKIEAEGISGGSAYVDGGSSGGGAIFALYTGTYTVDNTNTTPISAIGGVHANASANDSYSGGDGGAGGFHTAQLGRTISDLTLISSATTALAQPDTADLVMTYSNGAGTATINTDLKGYISRDNGTTYTEVTLVNEGTAGSDTILAARRVNISTQPAGTSMRYKVTTHNQSVSKETRVMGASLAWA